MMATEKKVAIILPNFNSFHYISSTIKSVINQTYKNWHLIIVDDASEERTKKILIMANRNGLIKNKQIIFLLYGIYLTLALYVGTEASSNRSFIILVLISILPDYLINHFKKDISR